MLTRVKHIFNNHKASIGYVIIVLATALGFYLLQQIGERLEYESVERTLSLCESQNEMKAILAEILMISEELSVEAGSLDDLTEAERQLYREYTERVYSSLDPVDCSKLESYPIELE